MQQQHYLFVHFREKTTPDGEQIYFGLSQDGFHWEAVNDGKPVLWTYYGNKGGRDFTIARCESTGRFVIVGTDLSLAYGLRNEYRNSWDEIKRNGSKCLSIWESEDLVNWTEQRLAPLGVERFGCLWAPDILKDKQTGEYVLHWSSSTPADNYDKMGIYCARTRDFREFSEPTLLYGDESKSVIDSAIYEEDGIYYLFVKGNTIELLRSANIEGPYERVEAFSGCIAQYIPKDKCPYEAATAVHLPDGRWCLFLDYFGVRGAGQGYVPFIADSLKSGAFHRSDSSFSFPYGFKHGTILKITPDEYDRIKAHAWDAD